MNKLKYVDDLERIINNNYPSFLENSSITINPESIEELKIKYFGDSDERYNFENLRQEIITVTKSKGRPEETDFDLAVKIHNYFNEHSIHARAAAFMPIWYYLTIFEVKDYVFWRFGAQRRRFYGTIGRNALSRLWLWGELSYDKKNSNPYHITGYKFNQQFLNFALETVLPTYKRITRLLAVFTINNIQEGGVSAKDDAIEYIFNRVRLLNTTRKLSVMTDKEINQYLHNFLNVFNSIK